MSGIAAKGMYCAVLAFLCLQLRLRNTKITRSKLYLMFFHIINLPCNRCNTLILYILTRHYYNEFKSPTEVDR